MAANDLLTTAEARTALNVSGSTLDTEIALYLTGVSTRIDALCGPVVARTVTSEKHDGGIPALERGRGSRLRGAEFIVPRLVPVYSVTSVTEYADAVAQVLTAETLTSQLTDMYLLDTSLKFYPRIWRRESGSDSLFPAERQNVVITYSAGRVAATANVTENFKLACTAILRRVWKREQSMWARTPAYSDEGDAGRAEGFYKAIDPMVREFLADELLTTMAY